jgi:beta-propeller repeat-containing protein
MLASVVTPTGLVREAWVRRYHGPGYGDSQPRDIAVDSAANVYVTGNSFGSPHNYPEYTTIKYDSDGNQLWLARYHYPLYAGDEARALALDADGNVFVTGNFCIESRIKGACTKTEYGTLKYDSQGQLLWTAQYHPTDYEDSAFAIAVDSAGNAYVTGSCCHRLPYGDYATVKYDSEGRQIWAARYHGSDPSSLDRATAIALDAQGNAYVTGGTDSGANHNYTTIKYDADGNEVWVARHPGSPAFDPQSNALALDVERNVYITGVSPYPDYDYLTVKYSPEGSEVWVTQYHADGNSVARALALDSSRNVYVTGQSSGGFTTVKYDSNGSEVLVAHYSGPGGSDWPNRIAVDSQDNVYVTGTSTDTFPSAASAPGRRADYATVKYDPEGNEVWVARYHGPVNYGDVAWGLAFDAEGNVYVTGWSYFQNVGTVDAEFATIKYSQ